MQTPKLEIGPYIRMARRRIWWIIIPFVMVLLAGLGFLKVSPKLYKASTLVLLEPQSIPDSFVRATVTESFAGRLRTIQQQIQSRTNLERIIKDFKLDSEVPQSLLEKILDILKSYSPSLGARFPIGERDERMIVGSLVDQIRKNMKVEMRASGGGGGPNRDQSLAFEIALEWHDGERIASVVNALAARFIQENLSAREERAIGTTDFLEKETAQLKIELEAREKELEAFKTQHMGTLPDQLESNIHIMNQLRDQLVNAERRLDQDKQEAMLLRSQSQVAQLERGVGDVTASLVNRIEREGVTSGAGGPRGGASGGRQGRQMTTEELTSGSLEQLEAELQRLKSQYTENHPDIIALKKRIETLRSEGSRSGADGLQREVSPQLAMVNARIESGQRELKEIEKQVQVYKDRVERTPEVEMAMSKLLRGYEIVRQRYDNLLSRKLDAKLAEEMEKKQKGEQFRVLDPAVKPVKPFKPDSRKILLLALAGGLGIGFGLAYAREVLDKCFHDPQDVEDSLGTPVIAILPMADKAG